MVNPEKEAVITIAGNIQKKKRNANSLEDLADTGAWKLKFESALIVDAVKLFYETIHSLTADADNNQMQQMYINPMPIHCKSNDNWADGYTIINSMKTVNNNYKTLTKLTVTYYITDMFIKTSLANITVGNKEIHLFSELFSEKHPRSNWSSEV